MIAMAENRKTKWKDLMESLDMKGYSKRTWKLLKNLSRDATKPPHNSIEVTADQVASQLLKNGKTLEQKTRGDSVVRQLENESRFLREPFSIAELKTAISAMQSNKVDGIDELRVEQTKNFDPRTTVWLLDVMNACVMNMLHFLITRARNNISKCCLRHSKSFSNEKACDFLRIPRLNNRKMAAI